MAIKNQIAPLSYGAVGEVVREIAKRTRRMGCLQPKIFSTPKELQQFLTNSLRQSKTWGRWVYVDQWDFGAKAQQFQCIYYNKNYVLFLRNPTSLSYTTLDNGTQVLHNSKAPAIVWGDGEQNEYRIYGVEVDEKVITMPHTITALQVLRFQNAEGRRCMLEAMGIQAFINDPHFTVLDQRKNYIEDTHEYLLRWSRGEGDRWLDTHCLLCTCPTRRAFVMLVTPECRTCQEAQNELWSGSPHSNVSSRIIGRT